mgnify:CR=1 FL=1
MSRSSIPRKTRNQQIYYATIQRASKQLSCSLSKELRKKYGKRSARIIEGDTALLWFVSDAQNQAKGFEVKLSLSPHSTNSDEKR